MRLVCNPQGLLSGRRATLAPKKYCGSVRSSSRLYDPRLSPASAVARGGRLPSLWFQQLQDRVAHGLAGVSRRIEGCEVLDTIEHDQFGGIARGLRTRDVPARYFHGHDVVLAAMNGNNRDPGRQPFGGRGECVVLR